MTSEQAAFFVDTILPQVQKEYLTTRRVLKAVPIAKESYRPHPDSRSAFELAWHIASSDVWFLDGFLTGKFEMDDDSIPADIGNTEDIVALYEDGFETKLPEVKKLTPEYWATPRPFFGIYNNPMALYLQFMLPPHDSPSRPAHHLPPADGRQRSRTFMAAVSTNLGPSRNRKRKSGIFANQRERPL